MNALLTTESPLVLLPSVASEFGIAEAVILQQIHYMSQQKGKGIVHDGHKWIYNTLDQWHAKLSCWSMATIERAITKLKKLGVILVDRLGHHKSIRTNYYRIDYLKLTHIPELSSPAKCENDPIKKQESTPQNDEMNTSKMRELIPAKCGNGITKNTQENTKKSFKSEKSFFEKSQQPTTERQTESPTPPPSNPLATGGTTTPQHPEPTTEQLANLPAAQTQLLKNLRLLKIDIAHNDPNLTHWIATGMVKHISQLAIQKSNGHWQTPAQLGLTKPKANRMGAAA